METFRTFAKNRHHFTDLPVILFPFNFGSYI